MTHATKIMALLALAACGEEMTTAPEVAAPDDAIGDTASPGDVAEEDTSASKDPSGPPPEPITWANGWPEGHELAPGLDLFLHDTWGLELYDRWPPASFMVALQEERPEEFGDQFSAYGFIPDPMDDLPVGFKRGSQDPTKVHGTCALCHTKVLPDGRYWLGAPNTSLRWARFQIDVNDAWVDAGNPPLLTETDIAELEAMGPARTNAGPSDYGVVPDDFPALFDLASRTRLSKMGTTRDMKSEVYLSLFGFGVGRANEDGEVAVEFPTDDYLQPFLATIGALAPPPPLAGADAALLARGAEVYEEAGCGGCHTGHTAGDVVSTVDQTEGAPEYAPGEHADYEHGTIRTDPFQYGLVGGAGGIDEGYEEFVLFIIERGLAVGSSDGYVAPDLQGVWATAPYLHNGSVPTLADLLRAPEERPASFEVLPGLTRTTEALGTTRAGHTFGTDLPEEDKAALVEYLESL